MTAHDSDDLIASFYDAATGRASWHTALHGIAGLLDLYVVQLAGVDLRQGRLTFSFEGGYGPPEGVIDYARTYHRMDPHASHVMQLPVGQLVSFSRAFEPGYIDRHPFYQDFLIPYGARHAHGVKLYQDEGTVVLLGLHRAVGKSPLEGSDWEAAQRLCFHLVRAVEIYAGMRRTLVDAVVGRETLDRLAVPVLLLDEQRVVVLQNKAAQQATDAGWPLHIGDDGRMNCSAVDADTEITLALRALQLSGSAGLQHGSGVDRMVVRVDAPGKARPLLACFLALRPNATMGAFGQSALAMLVIHDPNRPARIDPFGLAAAFELSPAEARVAVALASGASPKEIARDQGVSLNTVRTQVQAVHVKFGVGRTAELVALIHSLSFGALR